MKKIVLVFLTSAAAGIFFTEISRSDPTAGAIIWLCGFTGGRIAGYHLRKTIETTFKTPQ